MDEPAEWDRALALLRRLRQIRTVSDEVLRRFQAGETLAFEVQRSIFHAAYDMEQMCHRLEERLGRGQSG